MLLPATQFQFATFPLPPKFISDPSSSRLFFFPVPLSKAPIPRTQKILVRCSAADTQTVHKSAIQRIAEKLRSLGFTEEAQAQNSESESAQSNSAGEIFVPFPQKLPKHRIGYTIDPSWSTPANPVPQPGTGTAVVRYNELINEVKKQKKVERELGRDRREERVPTLAELSLSNDELRRLRALGIQLKQKLKVGKAGITEGIVNGIHERWRRSEVVKIVCEDICKLNMKRTHDLLERKTGGLVVWRSGSKIVLYRGADYKYPYFLPDKVLRSDNSNDALGHPDGDNEDSDKTDGQSSGINSLTFVGESPKFETAKPSLIQGVGTPNKVRFQLPGEVEFSEEADRLLMGLGPRFTDWWGYDPLPVDADLLPAVIPGYRKPFRLLPYGVKPKLTDDEMTTLKRLGRPLPCHFALGRNKKLQGLAAAIIKLWERCEIAKIAIKRGVQNTNSKMMAEELKQLTGGTLLSRDKEFIVLYRGKDFLPPAVSSAIEERRKNGMFNEELHVENSSSVTTTPELNFKTVECGPEDEFSDISCGKDRAFSEQRRLAEAAVRKTSIKLSTALGKKAKAEKLLAELEKSEEHQEPEVDKQGITEEERYMLRKIGLKMKPFLLLGRRGVFDGTVENMHLHWKYRELVKIICKEGNLEAVHQTARTLEAESGGILVAVEIVSKGYAIIVYRGKNYSRPASLRPHTLLNKKEAMKRSIEAQRRESLKLHVLKLNKNIDELKRQLVKDREANSKQITDASSRSELASENRGACLTSVNMNSQKAAPVNSQQEMLQIELTDDGGARQGEPEVLVGSVNKDTQASENRGACLTSVNMNSQKAAPVHSQQEMRPIELTDDGGARQGEPEVLVGSVNKDTQLVRKSVNEFPSRSIYLSNRERLLLRREALKMRKRPVLAVGQSNIVTGVAKTIKTHFKKYPLAIVNIKGRAKGTSVQEVVFKLEQATGGVLVSQEPSKVILYRGWGAGGKPSNQMNTNKTHKEGEAKPSVSPELLEAIRI